MQHEDWDTLCIWARLAAAGVALVWGALHPLVQTLLALMVLDVLMGIGAAYLTGSLSSTKTWRGAIRKVLALFLVAGAHVFEPVAGFPLAAPVAGFFTMHELLSVIENAAKAGLPIPEVLRTALVQLDQNRPPTSKSAPEKIIENRKERS